MARIIQITTESTRNGSRAKQAELLDLKINQIKEEKLTNASEVQLHRLKRKREEELEIFTKFDNLLKGATDITDKEIFKEAKQKHWRNYQKCGRYNCSIRRGVVQLETCTHPSLKL